MAMIKKVVQDIVDEVIELSADEEDLYKRSKRIEEKVQKVQPQFPPSRRSPTNVIDHKMQEIKEMRIEFTQLARR